jgi:hypothetical protein
VLRESRAAPGQYLPALAQDPTVLDRMRRFIFPNRFLI